MRTWSAGATPGRSTTCPPSRPRSRPGRPMRPGRRTSTASWPGPRSARTRGPASSTSRPGCGAEDFQLGKSLGLPVVAPLDESGIFLDGFGSLSGRDVRDVAEPIIEHLKREGRFYRLETITHRYPHCWRCNTPLVFRLVDEWYISMGPLYDQPRETLTPEQVDASLRYQIMDVVDQIRWIPDFGYERELDWLRNMHDWMISKKRYWGLALPIYDCASCGTVEVIGGREELQRAGRRGLGDVRGPHAAPAVRRRGEDRLSRLRRAGRAHQGRRQPVARCRHRAVLDAPFPRGSRLLARSGSRPTSSPRAFPGQFRNWFYSMLAMSTVLRREPPFKTIFGYATLFAEDGRPMHKSWGNAIEFDEAADRMGVDVMRWMFAKSRPEENILFGWHAADEARRELLVLWNVYAFFVTYARLAGWTPDGRRAAGRERPVLDRWILSRAAGTAATVEERLARRRRAGCRARPVRLPRRTVDLVPAPVAAAVLALGRSGRPGRRVRDAPRGARGELRGCSPRSCRSSPNRCTATSCAVGPAGRAGQRPPDALADRRARAAPRRGARGSDGQRAGRRRAGPDAARHGAPQDPPAAGDGLDRAAGPWPRRRRRPAPAHRRRDQRQGRSSSSTTNRRWSSGASSRSCPKIGKRLGSAIPAVMAAARSGEVTFEADGSVTLGRRHAGRPTRSRSRRRRDPGRRSPTTTAWSSSSTRR